MSDDKNQEANHDEKEALNRSNSFDSAKAADGAVIPAHPDAANMDQVKVKFINGGTTDAKVEMGDHDKDQEFVGLTKEELMKYANDPYWVRVRWILLILFWVAWFLMLAAAIIIIVLAPRCPHRPDLDWWQKEVIYQVYPRSFKDSDSDGIGDLKGIQSQLDYLKDDLKARAIWLNPIYGSPGKDLGYDISDYTTIDPIFGTLDDFRDLRISMHDKGMRLIMDFVPNHSSDEHPWFKESRSSKSDDNPYKDYYVWVDGTPGTPPNNWKSVFGGSAWTYDDKRGQYYLHQFLPEQPDLNLRNPKVQEGLEDVLRYWLKQGVDGFRVDAAAHLFENTSFADEPANPNATSGDSYDSLIHDFTTFLPETYDIITKWRKVLDEFYTDSEDYKFMIVEAYGTPEQMKNFYGYKDQKGADLPSNMGLTNLKKGCGPKCIRDIINNWMGAMDSNQWPNWVLGNHDQSRVGTRMGEEFVNAANMLALLLPGTATTYYGEEIGMVDGDIDWEDGQDTVAKKDERTFKEKTRDPERTPMQWNTQPFAGFTDGNDPWLPVNQDYPTRNVQVQLAHGAGITNIEVYKTLSVLREEPSFSWGSYKEAVVDDNILSFVRDAEGFDSYLVVINFGTRPEGVDLHSKRKDLVSEKGEIIATTSNFDDHYRAHDFMKGKTVSLNNVMLRPGEGVVFKMSYETADE